MTGKPRKPRYRKGVTVGRFGVDPTPQEIAIAIAIEPLAEARYRAAVIWGDGRLLSISDPETAGDIARAEAEVQRAETAVKEAQPCDCKTCSGKKRAPDECVKYEWNAAVERLTSAVIACKALWLQAHREAVAAGEKPEKQLSLPRYIVAEAGGRRIWIAADAESVTRLAPHAARVGALVLGVWEIQAHLDSTLGGRK